MSAATTGPMMDASVTVGTGAVVALARNESRQALILQNVSTSNSAAFTADGSVPTLNTAGSFQLSPGQAFLFDSFVPTGAITVIASASGTGITIKWM